MDLKKRRESSAVVKTGEYVPIASKFWLSSADGVCGTLSGLITGGGVTYFYTKYMGMDARLAEIVWMIFAIWNALNDPLFGYLSDRTKSKLGRRIPYIRYGAFFYGLIFILTWLPWPFAGGQLMMFVQMLVSLFLFDTFYTAIATSLYVMPYSMAESNQARSGIFVWRLFFTLFSIIAPLVIFPKIRPDVGESATYFRIIMIIIGIFSASIIFVSTFFYKEKYQTETDLMPGIGKSLLQCFKNRAFWIYEIISFTILFTQTILMQGVTYYFDEFQTPMYVIYGSMGIGALCGIILWVKKMESWGIAKSIAIMSIIFVLAGILVILLGKYPIAAGISFFFVGTVFSGGMYLVPLMSGEVIDFDESKTGIRREGMYAGVNSLITKPAISIANAAFLAIISAFGYNSDLKAGLQSEGAKQGVLIGWMLLPVVLFAISALAMKFYPLYGDIWKKTKLELARKHKGYKMKEIR